MESPLRRALLGIAFFAVMAMPLACQRNFNTPRLSPDTPVGAWASPTPTYTLGPNCPHSVQRDITFYVNNGPVTGNTCGGASRFLDLGLGPASPDHLFLLRVDTLSHYVFSLCGGASWDTVFYIRTICDQSSTTIDRNDDGCASRSLLSANLSPGEYYLILDGYGYPDDCGSYSFTVRRSAETATLTPTPPGTPTQTPTLTPTPT